MEQNNTNNKTNNCYKNNYKTQLSNIEKDKLKGKNIPKKDDTNFLWYNNTPNDSQALNELDDIFGY